MNDPFENQIPGPEKGGFAARVAGAAGIGASILTALWCLTPTFMAGYALVMGKLGKFQAAPDGGAYIYSVSLQTYLSLIRALGTATILFCVLVMLLNLKNNLNLHRRVQPWNAFLLLTLVWAGVCTLCSDDPMTAFTGVITQYNGFSSMLIYGGIFACAAMIRRDGQRKWLLRLFCAVVSVLAALMLAQSRGSAFLDYCFPTPRAVVFNQFNHFGYVLGMGILGFVGLFFFDREAGRILKTVYITGLGLLSYALHMNDTFGALVAAAAALVILYIFCWRSGGGRSLHVLFPAAVFGIMAVGAPLWTLAAVPVLYFALSFLPLRVKPVVLIALILLLVLAAAALMIFTPYASGLKYNLKELGDSIISIIAGGEKANSAGTGRGKLWKDTIRIIFENPIYGLGPDGFVIYRLLENNQNPHNEYLMAAGMLGIPGLLLYLAGILSLLVCGWKRFRKLEPMTIAVLGVALTYLISALFGNPTFNTAPFFWLFLGMSAGGISASQTAAPALPTGREKGKTAAVLAACLAACGILTFLGIRWSSAHLMETESDREQEDIKKMFAADLVMDIMLGDADWKEDGSYWYDPDGSRFVPEEDIPSWRGAGTRSPGGGLEKLKNQLGDIAYDETMNYRDKLLRARCVGSAENPQFTLEWARPEP